MSPTPVIELRSQAAEDSTKHIAALVMAINCRGSQIGPDGGLMAAYPRPHTTQRGILGITPTVSFSRSRSWA